MVNTQVDRLIESLFLHQDPQFLTHSVGPLLTQRPPPLLQALLKAATVRLKAHSQVGLDASPLSEPLSLIINHPNADVRKCCVFCLVEIAQVADPPEVFQQEFMARLNPSQQKLVDIYIKRRAEEK